MCLLLFLALCLTAPAPTESIFSTSSSIDAVVNFFCGIPTKLVFVNIRIYELDGVSNNDRLAEWFDTVETGNQTVTFDRIYPGGDRTPSYEIIAVITHNCTSDYDKYLCLKPESPTDISVRGNQKFFYSANITNNGYEGFCT